MILCLQLCSNLLLWLYELASSQCKHDVFGSCRLELVQYCILVALNSVLRGSKDNDCNKNVGMWCEVWMTWYLQFLFGTVFHMQSKYKASNFWFCILELCVLRTHFMIGPRNKCLSYICNECISKQNCREGSSETPFTVNDWLIVCMYVCIMYACMYVFF
jgi:hypothetical protein